MEHQHLAALYAALAAAQAEMPAALKNATNPHLKSRYADLSSVWASARPILAKHGLAVIQGFQAGDSDAVVVWTVLVHKSGATHDCGTLKMPYEKKTPQAVGAAVTYGKRYGLTAALGIVAADEDDDGEGARNRAKEHAEDLMQTETKPPTPAYVLTTGVFFHV